MVDKDEDALEAYASDNEDQGYDNNKKFEGNPIKSLKT